MYQDEAGQFYLGSVPQMSNQADISYYDFFEDNLFLIEIATGIIILSAIILIG